MSCIKFFCCGVSMTTGSKMCTLVLDTEQDVIDKLGQLIEKKAHEAIGRNDVFTVGLSGGSVCTFLCKALPKIISDWSKWKLFFCDERVVSFDDNDSTFKLYRENLLRSIPLDEKQFVIINPNLPCKDAAVDYENKLKEAFPGKSLPNFDLLLLGIGPDGHTCSLFPSHPLLDEKNVWVAPIEDSPKPPPCRVTLTFPVINNAKSCVFAMAGSGKADIVKRLLKDKEDLPANRVKPENGELYWILDKSAAANIEQ